MFTYIWSYIHAFMHLCLVQVRLLRGEDTDESSKFYKSRGTLKWVRFIPVKVEPDLTGIMPSYIFIDVHF